MPRTSAHCITIVAFSILFVFATLQLSYAMGGGGEGEPGVFQPSPSAKRPAAKPRKKTIRKPKRQSKPRNETAVKRKNQASKRRVRPQPFVPRETSPSGMPPDGETRFAERQVIVRYQLNAPQSRMNRLVASLNLRHDNGRTFALAGITAHKYTIVSDQTVRQVITALETDPVVVYAQPNYYYRLQQTSAKAAAPQYAFARLALDPANSQSGAGDVRIAVLDSLVDETHPELQNAGLEITNLTDRNVPDQHGTSIAGILSADGSLRGIAPGAHLHGIAVFWKDEDGNNLSDSWTIGTGMDDAAANKADILNLSFAGPSDPLIENSLEGAKKNGITSIAAAGNNGPEAPPLFPAAYENVIAVTATDRNDAIYPRANQGAYIELAAPGVDILAPVPDKGYNTSSGTSFATAYVSGLSAILMAKNPALDTESLRKLLSETANDLGEAGPDSIFGAGLPDGKKALAAVQGSQE